MKSTNLKRADLLAIISNLRSELYNVLWLLGSENSEYLDIKKAIELTALDINEPVSNHYTVKEKIRANKSDYFCLEACLDFLSRSKQDKELSNIPLLSAVKFLLFVQDNFPNIIAPRMATINNELGITFENDCLHVNIRFNLNPKACELFIQEFDNTGIKSIDDSKFDIFDMTEKLFVLKRF
mgnify:CR=1 FL=1